jgi:hypothetical protein
MSDGNGLVTTIELNDAHGGVIGTREVVTYAGLLNRAHQEGLKSIATTLVQAPSEANEMTAISMAEVVTERGVFRDYGDANPTNVDAMIIPHIIRMSVTRAKARALRDAINVGVVSLEELCQEATNGACGKLPDGSPQQPPNGKVKPPPKSRQREPAKPPMSEHQEKYLYQLLEERGIHSDEADEWLCKTCGAGSISKITRKQASDLIDHILHDLGPQQQSIN